MFKNKDLEKFCDEKWLITKAVAERDEQFPLETYALSESGARLLDNMGIVQSDDYAVTYINADTYNEELAEAMPLGIDSDDTPILFQTVQFLFGMVYMRIAAKQGDEFIDIQPFTKIGGQVCQ
jgi:hypothetical protein